MFDTEVIWWNYYVIFHKSTCKFYRQPSLSVFYVNYISTNMIGWFIMIRQLVFVVEEPDAGYLGQSLDINQISETFDYSRSEWTCKSVNFLRDI